MKFSVGDRVRVYATLNGVMAETPGQVIEIRDKDEMLIIALDGPPFQRRRICAHPKQCRRLRPKKLREFWVGRDGIDSILYKRELGFPFVSLEKTPKMERLIFKAENFKCWIDFAGIPKNTGDHLGTVSSKIAAEAQTKFDAWYKANIEDAPKVTGEKWKSFGPWHREQHPEDTHTAKLVDIQEIK